MNVKKCAFCGQEFTPRSNRQIYCNREHWRQCPSCGQMYLEKYSENLKKPPRLCCSNCQSKNQEHELPKFRIVEELKDTVIIDSTIPRNKYENLHISQYFDRKGIKCVHVFPEDNINRILKSINITSVYNASEFQVYKLNLDYAAEFLEQNDVVKFYKNTSLALGLVKNYEIFQVMTFAKPRYNKKFDYEIIRCCSKLGTKIESGLDPLSSSASLQFGITSCIAYQDRSKNFDSCELQAIGMRLDHINPPVLRKSDIYDCGVSIYVF